jgi:hypothetical protein
MQTSHRYVKVTDIASGSVYVIQEMIRGAHGDKWADLSSLEVQDGGSASVHVRKPLRVVHHQQRPPKGMSKS